MDEALALPSEQAVTLAMRTQQVILEESGVSEHGRSARAAVISWRALTNANRSAEALRILSASRRSSAVSCLRLRRALFQAEIADASYRANAREIESWASAGSSVSTSMLTLRKSCAYRFWRWIAQGYERQLARLEQVAARAR